MPRSERVPVLLVACLAASPLLAGCAAPGTPPTPATEANTDTQAPTPPPGLGPAPPTLPPPAVPPLRALFTADYAPNVSEPDDQPLLVGQAPPPAEPLHHGSAVALGSIARGDVPVGAAVTTAPASVVRVSCPSCGSPTTAADFWSQAGNVTLRMHLGVTFHAGGNHKKQSWLPLPGWSVQAQGTVQRDAQGWFVDVARWGTAAHPGATVDAATVARGGEHEGSYAWLAPVRVVTQPVQETDGDWVFDVQGPSGGKVHLEMPPPYQQLAVPHLGDTVTPWGYVHFDGDHAWWELHPVRCLGPAACVPEVT
jgi:hypothetical protein